MTRASAIAGDTVRDRYQLLLAEGAASDADLILSELGRAGLDVEVQKVATALDLDKALAAKPWDFIIFAEHIPELDWATALGLCKQKGLDIPFIMLSGVPDADPGVDRIKAGVHEHLLKHNLVHLPQIVRRELRAVRERWIRKETETAARLLNSNSGGRQSGVIGLDSDGIIVSWNSGAERLYGYSASEMIGRSVSVGPLGEVFTKVHTLKKGQCAETKVAMRKDASFVNVQIVCCLIEDPVGRIIGSSILVWDVAESEAWSQAFLASLRESVLARGATKAEQ